MRSSAGSLPARSNKNIKPAGPQARPLPAMKACLETKKAPEGAFHGQAFESGPVNRG
jgi:hypothetical protein